MLRSILRLRLLGGRSWCWPFLAFAGTILACIMAALGSWPTPNVHDEFAYQLGSETFATGRLSNPPHPHADHFATWHVIQQPSYQSKYPPAQSLSMAIGKLFLGEALYGIWLVLAAAAGCTTWAAQMWLPKRWTPVVAILLLTHTGMIVLWGNSYWGGGVAMLAGSLLLVGYSLLRRADALRRFRIDQSLVLAGAFVGTGLSLLAASRPVEGAVGALPLAVGAIWSSRRLAARQSLQFWGGSIAILFVGAALLGTYNAAATGKWYKMPYQVWTASQGDAQAKLNPFALNPVVDRVDSEQEAVADFRVAEIGRWMERRNNHAFEYCLHKLKNLAKHLGNYFMVIPCLIGFAALANKRLGLPVVLSAGCVLLTTVGAFSAGHPHYIAGIFPVLLVATVIGLRWIWIRFDHGKAVVRIALALWLILNAIAMLGQFNGARASKLEWAHRRLELIDLLSESSQPQLVFVRYLPGHIVHQEWVYNGPDVDHQQVIFANDLGAERNRELLSYYSSCEIPVEASFLEVGKGVERLKPYFVGRTSGEDKR